MYFTYGLVFVMRGQDFVSSLESSCWIIEVIGIILPLLIHCIKSMSRTAFYDLLTLKNYFCVLINLSLMDTFNIINFKALLFLIIRKYRVSFS